MTMAIRRKEKTIPGDPAGESGRKPATGRIRPHFAADDET